MKTSSLALLLSLIPSSTAFYLPSSTTTIIASSITSSSISSRFSSSSRLKYKTSHYEYGNSDDRIIQRATSEDRWNVLKVLENDVLLNVEERRRNSKRQRHDSLASSSASSTTSIQPNVSNEVTWEVDADRFSLASLLEPPAAPFVKRDDQSTVVSTSSPLVMPTSSRIITTKTSSIITPLQSIQDYNHHILNTANNNHSKNQLKLIRFTAPWCQVCRSTAVAYERMVSKLSKHNSNDVAFYSVSIDSNDPSDSKNVLKDYLNVNAVPTCIIYHKSKGIVGKITLNRSNLNELKKRLDGYVNGALYRQGEMMWMEALVMGLEQ